MADTHKTLRCPACQKDMEKIFMPAEGVNIDVCIDGCGGIYFDTREFKAFDEPHENIDDLLTAVEGKTFDSVDQNLPRSCPACGARMHKNFASIRKEVSVDDCYSCGGKFLDHGELTKIRSQYGNEQERTDAVLKEVYSTVGLEIMMLEEKQERLRQNRSPLKKLFDKMIYG